MKGGAQYEKEDASWGPCSRSLPQVLTECSVERNTEF